MEPGRSARAGRKDTEVPLHRNVPATDGERLQARSTEARSIARLKYAPSGTLSGTFRATPGLQPSTEVVVTTTVAAGAARVPRPMLAESTVTALIAIASQRGIAPRETAGALMSITVFPSAKHASCHDGAVY